MGGVVAVVVVATALTALTAFVHRACVTAATGAGVATAGVCVLRHSGLGGVLPMFFDVAAVAIFGTFLGVGVRLSLSVPFQPRLEP